MASATLPLHMVRPAEKVHLPVWVWVLALLMALLTLFVTLPANWLACWIDQRTAGRIMLADARGTVWQGSAVLSFGGGGDTPAAASFSLPGRLQWQLHWPADWSAGLALPIRLQHDTVLERPVELALMPTQLSIAAGAIRLPLALTTLFGAPMNTLRLQGTAQLQWNDLRLPFNGSTGMDTAVDATTATLRLTDVSSAINAGIAAIRPLGLYRIEMQFRPEQKMQWQLVTEQGPVQLQGNGSWKAGGMSFTGTAGLAPETPAMTRVRLQPLLNVLGRPQASAARNGNGKDSQVNIQIGG